LRKVRAGEGRFRNFLLMCLRNEWICHSRCLRMPRK
jgi:hypothetical protein